MALDSPVVRELNPNIILVGHVLDKLAELPDECIDLCCTSPPYWGLRNYGESASATWGGDHSCDHAWGDELPAAVDRHSDEGFAEYSAENFSGGAHRAEEAVKARPTSAGSFCTRCGAWRGQLGVEPHPSLYIEHLVEVSRAIRRVLKPTGTFWLNLGDTYCNIGKWVKKQVTDEEAGKNYTSTQGGSIDAYNVKGHLKRDGGWLQEKQLLMIPARVAAALQDDGWILRNDIIWFKRNAMPTSAKDRLKCSHEHIFFLAKQPHYYFNLDAIRKPYSQGTLLRFLERNVFNQTGGPKQDQLRGAANDATSDNQGKSNLVMQSLAERVWEETGRQVLNVKREHQMRKKDTQNHSVVASVNAGSYRARCRENGIPEAHPMGATPPDVWDIPTHGYAGAHFAVYPEELIEPIIKGACPTDGIVLDPFLGSGTTALVARRLHRKYLGVEINPDYVEIAKRRIRGEKKHVENTSKLG